MSNSKKLMTCLLMFLVVSGTCAQQELSLSKAIKLGLERNYDIRIENKNVETATNNNKWGEAGLYPSVSLDVNQNNNLTDNVETAFPTATQGQVITNSLSPGINLNWTIFNGFKAHMSKSRLENLQSESEGNASVVVSNTIQAIVLGYYKVMVEKEALDELQKQLDLSRDKFDYTRIKNELGSAVSSDLLLEEGNYLSDSINLINQELVYRKSKRDLNVLLAEDDLTQEYVYTDELKSITIGNYDFALLLGQLDESNVDLKKAYIAQSIARQNTAISKVDRYPTISVGAGYNDNRQRLDLSSASFFTGEGFASGPDESLSSITDTYFMNFTLSFSLFNGGRINRAIQNTIIQEDINNLQVSQLKNSLTRDLYNAYDDYNSRKRLFEINVRREESALTNLNISQDKFKTGTINSFDYRTVQNNHLSAAIQKLQALYSLIDAKVALMRLTGGILESYVE